MKILILGANGMIGSSIFAVLCSNRNFSVWGALRKKVSGVPFFDAHSKRLLAGLDALNINETDSIVKKIKPQVVINCVGVTKHNQKIFDLAYSIQVNSLFSHQLAKLCKSIDARLIHISTDCVFKGSKGMYLETDIPDSDDFYGRTKSLGELIAYNNAVTLRTSTIGHEIGTCFGLLEWFLSQENKCKGYSRAVFSGLPTIILAEIIRDFVIPQTHLNGLYHVASKPIDKFKLLQIISKIYKKNIIIEPDSHEVIDRSLIYDRFSKATGYIGLEWEEMITMMHERQVESFANV